MVAIMLPDVLAKYASDKHIGWGILLAVGMFYSWDSLITPIPIPLPVSSTDVRLGKEETSAKV